jgi:iron(III) transport system permease protein
VIPPLVSLVQGSLRLTTPSGDLGDFTLDHYRRILSDRQFYQSLANSLVFCIGTAVLAIGMGGVVAWFVVRTSTPFKSLAYLSAIVSLGTPYVLYVTAWLFLLGRSGPVNGALMAMTGSVRPILNVYSLTGMILIEGFLWSPLAFLLLAAVFRSANADYEEAARMSGAGIPRTLVHVSLRMMLPALLAVAVLIAVRSLEAFEVPTLVGLPGAIKLLTTEIYLDMKKSVPPDLGYASAFSVVLLTLAAILLYFYSRLVRNAARFHTVTGRGYRPRHFELGRVRYLGDAFVLLNFILILVVPTLALLWLSLMPFSQTISLNGLKALTLENYDLVFHSGFYIDLAWKTWVMSAGAATLVMAVTVLSAWLAVRRRAGAFLLDQLATVPLVFPGIVLGVAMIQILLAAPVPVYGTIWAFVIAFAIRYLPYGMRYASSGMLQVHPELEEAAGVAGGSPLRGAPPDRHPVDPAGDRFGVAVHLSDRGARCVARGHAGVARGGTGRGRDVRSLGQWTRYRAGGLRAGVDRDDDRRGVRALRRRPAGRGIGVWRIASNFAWDIVGRRGIDPNGHREFEAEGCGPGGAAQCRAGRRQRPAGELGGARVAQSHAL